MVLVASLGQREDANNGSIHAGADLRCVYTDNLLKQRVKQQLKATSRTTLTVLTTSQKIEHVQFLATCRTAQQQHAMDCLKQHDAIHRWSAICRV